MRGHNDLWHTCIFSFTSGSRIVDVEPTQDSLYDKGSINSCICEVQQKLGEFFGNMVQHI